MPSPERIAFNPNRSFSIENNSVLNANPRLNLPNYTPSQMSEIRSIINTQQSSTRAMDSSSLTSLANSGILERYNQQFTSSRPLHQGNALPNVIQSSLTSHSPLTGQNFFGALNQIRNLLNNETESTNSTSSNPSNQRQSNAEE